MLIAVCITASTILPLLLLLRRLLLVLPVLLLLLPLLLPTLLLLVLLQLFVHQYEMSYYRKCSANDMRSHSPMYCLPGNYVKMAFPKLLLTW